MNIGFVALVAAVLSAPALIGMLQGSVDPAQSGVRLLLAVLCAIAFESVVRHFLHAVSSQEGPVEATGAQQVEDPGTGQPPRRRRSDA